VLKYTSPLIAVHVVFQDSGKKSQTHAILSTYHLLAKSSSSVHIVHVELYEASQKNVLTPYISWSPVNAQYSASDSHVV
jgi:hypothetical protein